MTPELLVIIRVRCSFSSDYYLILKSVNNPIIINENFIKVLFVRIKSSQSGDIWARKFILDTHKSLIVFFGYKNPNIER